MIITATQKNTRQAPRKVRLVANTVKKMSIPQALTQLSVIERRSSLVVLKVLRQAIANAVNNHNLQLSDLTIKSIQVGTGPTYKRYRAASRGRANSIFKRTSHITVELETAPPKTEAKPEAVETQAVEPKPTVTKKKTNINKKEVKSKK